MVYVALLRGINVGGNNKIAMAELKSCLEELGYQDIRTYINSGNILFRSNETAAKITIDIETTLLARFPHTTMPIKVAVLSRDQLAKVIKNAPRGFGAQPDTYHSDVAFLIGVSSAQVMKDIETNPEVDTAWAGMGVFYYQRLSAKRTRSRLGRVISKPIYKFMTIRSWSTVKKLDALMKEVS